MNTNRGSQSIRKRVKRSKNSEEYSSGSPWNLYTEGCCCGRTDALQWALDTILRSRFPTIEWSVRQLIYDEECCDVLKDSIRAAMMIESPNELLPFFLGCAEEDEEDGEFEEGDE